MQMSTPRSVFREVVSHTAPVNIRRIHINQALLLSELQAAIQRHVIITIHTSVTFNVITYIVLIVLTMQSSQISVDIFQCFAGFCCIFS